MPKIVTNWEARRPTPEEAEEVGRGLPADEDHATPPDDEYTLGTQPGYWSDVVLVAPPGGVGGKYLLSIIAEAFKASGLVKGAYVLERGDSGGSLRRGERSDPGGARRIYLQV